MSARTVLPRNQPQITRHLLPTLKTGNISHGQHKGHRSDRPHSRLRHQQPRFFVLLRGFHHGLVEQADLPIQHLSYPEQVFSPPAGPGLQGKLAQRFLARFAPQLSLLGSHLDSSPGAAVRSSLARVFAPACSDGSTAAADPSLPWTESRSAETVLPAAISK